MRWTQPRGGRRVNHRSLSRGGTKMCADENVTPIVVVAAIIRDGARVLACRRPEHKRYGGLWEFPGGKVESGETREEAVRREIKEELGLYVVSTGRTLFVATDPGSPFQVEFIETEAIGSPGPTEHSEISWCSCDDLASDEPKE